MIAPGIADLASSEWAAEYMSAEVQRAEGTVLVFKNDFMYIRFSFLCACSIYFKYAQALLKLVDVVYVVRTYFVGVVCYAAKCNNRRKM